MKRMTALVLIICMLIPTISLAEVLPPDGKIYIFGDDWAYAWGNKLKDFVYDEGSLVNAAGVGELLSGIYKKAEYGLVTADDVVILSYGILEKDRPGDKNAEFEKNLDSVVTALRKKGAEVIFASVCSTMRYNTVTGQMAETKNFYTETMRSYAKKNNVEYVDLALLTASWASRLGSQGADRLYTGTMSLSDNGNRMCAYEVFKAAAKHEQLAGKLKSALSRVYIPAMGEYTKTFDVFYEENICDYFTIYIKGGRGVSINGAFVPDGDGAHRAESVNGKITVSFSACEKMQLAPSYRFEAYGFATTEAPFEREFMPGCYDVTVKKSEPLKASVYLNGFLIASNLDMPGTQIVIEAAEHTFEEYHLEEGKIEVTVNGLTDKLDYISLCESAVIYEDKPRIFVGGDSTVCNYYPLLRTGQEEDGTVMTGWAMLLEDYVDADVMNLAASGDWAANWLEKSFPIIEKEGGKGDIFIVQFGINDHDKSTIGDMTAALSEMIDRAAAKGIIPILVSPQISAGYGWGEATNIGKSDGGAYEEFFNAVRELSVEKGCFYVDLTDLSAGWFSEIGRDNVYKKYHLWDYENDKPKDMMHLSYKGANALCRFFVLGLEKIASSNQTDKWGNSLSLLKIW